MGCFTCISGYQGNNDSQVVVFPKLCYLVMSIYDKLACHTNDGTNHHLTCWIRGDVLFHVELLLGATCHSYSQGWNSKNIKFRWHMSYTWHHHVIKSWHHPSVILVLDILISLMFLGCNFLVPSLHAYSQ